MSELDGWPHDDALDDAEAQVPEANRDPGADMEREGVPDVADDRTPGTGDIPEPGRPSAPTDAPTASTSYGMTEWEQRHPEGHADRLAAEASENTEVESERPPRQPEEEALRISDEPDSPAGEGP